MTHGPGQVEESALILLVEDDEANLLLTQVVLEQAGHRVVTATTVGDARALLTAEPPDLVLTDLSLPDQCGLDLVREVRGNPRTCHIPVVALTAHAMPGTEAEARDAGCCDYITKPIDIVDLIRRVEASIPGRNPT